MAVLQLMFCVNVNVNTGRWAGMYIFERDKEIILYKGWNMLHNVLMYWPSGFLYELFYVMINNVKNV